MKSIYFAIAITFTVLSCSGEKKQENNSLKQEIKITPKYTKISVKDATINWTAYKTTAKKPVKGKFLEFGFNTHQGGSVREVLDNAILTIEVNSINSGNEERDAKLKKDFFGVMSETNTLEGKLKFTAADKGVVSFKMNAVTVDFPVKIDTQEDKIIVSGLMNLDNWKAQAAIKALNIVCGDLHKGDDGVSKTWSEVNIEVVLPYTK